MMFVFWWGLTSPPVLKKKDMDTIIFKDGKPLSIKSPKWEDLHSYHSLSDEERRQLIRKDLFEYKLQEEQDDIYFNNLKKRLNGIRE
jgi:hypothetical protein